MGGLLNRSQHSTLASTEQAGQDSSQLPCLLISRTLSTMHATAGSASQREYTSNSASTMPVVRAFRARGRLRVATPADPCTSLIICRHPGSSTGLGERWAYCGSGGSSWLTGPGMQVVCCLALAQSAQSQGLQPTSGSAACVLMAAAFDREGCCCGPAAAATVGGGAVGTAAAALARGVDDTRVRPVRCDSAPRSPRQQRARIGELVGRLGSADDLLAAAIALHHRR